MTTITVYNLSVKIETNDYNLLSIIREFVTKHYTSNKKGFSINSTNQIKSFYSKVKNHGIYYLHVRQFAHLCRYLTDIDYDVRSFTKIDKRDYKEDLVDYEVLSNWKLKDHQIAPSEFLLNNPYGSKLLSLPTGSGKTITSSYTIAKLNKKLAIVILPQFIDKWQSDILSIYNIKPTDIMVIQGSKALRAFIELGKTNSLDSEVYIFSNRTLQDYITQYEEDMDLCIEMYGCEPIELFPIAGIGVLLIDESHMQWNSIFKILIHTNVKYQIGLSATMISDDNLVSKMHDIVYKEKDRYTPPLEQGYTHVYAIAFNIGHNNLKLIKTTSWGSNIYSHVAYEQSILKQPKLLTSYFNMITSTIDSYYIDEYKEKDKCLIFVSTINLANKLTEHIANLYRDFKVTRYCEDDPYENIMDSDICISTVQSAGTGLDIPKLRVVIQTVSISSQVANIQSLGRLRKLPDRDVKFCYLYANNIPKHKEYHLKKVELFRNRVANIAYRSCTFSL